MAFDIGYMVSPNLPWDALTQIDLFALETTNGPNLDTHFLNGINVLAWTAAARAHGVDPFIAIGGSDDQNWHNACNTTNRAQFVQNLVAYAVSNGFAGIDLDMESNVWSAQGPPSPGMTACIVAAADAAHAAGLQVSADVITPWQGSWFTPSQSHVDQFNLMTYGDSVQELQTDVARTVQQGLPATKLVVGVDIFDGPDPPPGGCAQFSTHAAQAGLAGAFVWFAEADATHSNVCLNGLG